MEAGQLKHKANIVDKKVAIQDFVGGNLGKGGHLQLEDLIILRPVGLKLQGTLGAYYVGDLSLPY